MGRLENRDAWERLLDGAVVDALDQWLELKDFRLKLVAPFDGGKSGEPVGRVMRIYDNHSVDQAVLKFFPADAPSRIKNLTFAQRASGEFGRRLAAVDGHTDALGGWRGVFMKLAGGSLEHVKQLSELTGDPDFAPLCGKITGSIVHDWNPDGPKQRPDATSVGELLKNVLQRRRAEAENWLRARRIDITGAEEPFRSDLKPSSYLLNPFSLVTGRYATETISPVLVGKTHGDLNGRNILVPRGASAAELYHLIDYDRFDAEAPLARDPMNLLVALALEVRGKLNDRKLDAALAEVLVNPEADRVDWYIENLRLASRAVHTSTAPPSNSALVDQWNAQCLLALAGAGLRRLGRKIDDDAKEWCLYLAARATESFVDRFCSTTGSPESHAVVTATIQAVRTEHGMVDRHEDLHRLRSRLTNGPWGVTTLHGTRGVGKTKLVHATLDVIEAVDQAPNGPRIHRHSVDADGQLDAKTLVDYLQGAESGRAPGNGSAVVRLEAVLKSLGEAPVVIAVDGVESLLDPDTKQLVDPYLDAALETLATESDHKVAVLLVSSERPTSPTNGTWPDADTLIPLRRFDPPELREYLERLGRNNTYDPDDLSDDAWKALYRSLQGNPRLAELAHAVVSVANTDLDLKSLTTALRKQDIRHVHDYLTRRMLRGLSDVKRQIVRALAAFGTPVPASAVIELVRDETPDTVTSALRDLAANRVIHEVDEGRYAVPRQDARLILGATPDDTEVLYFRAASQLTHLRHPDPRSVRDLQTHFAEIDALLNSGDHGPAYGIIRLTHDVLIQWNCDHLLLAQREAVRPWLQNEVDAMSNHNALGHIYESLQRPGAVEQYQAALTIADRLGLHRELARIYVNIGMLYWRRDHIEEALAFHERARELAERINDPKTLMGALEGIARCLQRRGRYEKPMELAEAALLLPDHPRFPDGPKEQVFAATRRVEISLWLARRHAELGNLRDAERMVDAAQDVATNRPNNWLLAPCLDGRADLLFDLGRFDEAREAAVNAVALAQEVHDEEVLRRARTTLAMIYLSTDQPREAQIEIDKLQRLRRSHGSLFVLAFHALAAHQKEDEALTRFQSLLARSTGRANNDPADYAAWNFRGFALCGLHLHQGDDLDEALVSFRTARELTPPSRILTGRIRFLVEQLHSSEKLRAALAVLG